MPSRRANPCNTNAVPPVSDHWFTNTEFGNVNQLLAYCVANQKNQRVLVTNNTSGGLVVARVRDFFRMNPLEFLGSKDVAHIWFTKFNENRGADANPMTWECFARAFLDRFFPRELREAKSQEFMNLRQGTMSVQECGLKFTQLSSYAPHMVTDPRAQMCVVHQPKVEVFFQGGDGVLRYQGRLCVPNVKLERQKPGCISQEISIPTWKWEVIKMDFIMGLPCTRRQLDSIWVIVDRVTKSAHFLVVKTTDSAKDYAKLYINEIVRLHGVHFSIISDRGP
ncbi:hypothetical protein MTR67_052104 [Solanum verrucosum]|uniref:Retrotransposon gag domain-containing protein n=1 Tax=Solanum verrucosum TaxID=315347 RepID=A0AAF0V7E7_SOLVR|nr:hypothetical protein MTR67_052104 [Solanum verrucosum]